MPVQGTQLRTYSFHYTVDNIMVYQNIKVYSSKEGDFPCTTMNIQVLKEN